MSKQKKWTLNIGTVIFGALFLYLVISFIIYMTTDHVISYLVTYGTLSSNETYTALVLRTEETAKATANGYVSYFIPDTEKTSKGETVAEISSKPAEEKPIANLDTDDLERLKNLASDFAKSYRQDDYSSVYDFQDSLQSELSKSEAAKNSTDILMKAAEDGIVAYTFDGYENLTVDDFQPEDLNSKTYHSQKVDPSQSVTSGDTIYRLITSNHWDIVFEVSDRQYAALSSLDTVRVKFNKDGHEERGNLKLLDRNEKHYAQITFYNGMVRYCNDRYLDIELVTTTETGLKIPVSSVVSKEFYTIPTDYLTVDPETGSSGFLKRTKGSDGVSTTTFVSAELYEKKMNEEGTDGVYYVDTNTFTDGDVLVHPDSSETYTVGDKAELDGVYSTNRGFALFRKIEILDQNEEYCLIASGTTYGVSLYDYIVKDGAKVKEHDILY